MRPTEDLGHAVTSYRSLVDVLLTDSTQEPQTDDGPGLHRRPPTRTGVTAPRGQGMDHLRCTKCHNRL